MAPPNGALAIREMTANGMNQREIANVLGVGKGTVWRESAPDGACSNDKDANSAPDGAGEMIQRAIEDAWNDAQLENAAVGTVRVQSASARNTEARPILSCSRYLGFVESFRGKLPDLFGLVSCSCRPADRFP